MLRNITKLCICSKCISPYDYVCYIIRQSVLLFVFKTQFKLKINNKVEEIKIYGKGQKDDVDRMGKERQLRHHEIINLWDKK
jgi:hypothetical protein